LRLPDGYRAALAGGVPVPVRLADGRPALVVSRYADVQRVLTDPRFARSLVPGEPMFTRTKKSLALAMSDPPEHSRRRSAVAAAFSARSTRRWATLVARTAGEQAEHMRRLADPADPTDPPARADLIAGFCLPFPLRVMTEILGVPYPDAAALVPDIRAMMSLPGADPAVVAAAHQRVAGYFEELVRRAGAGAGGAGTGLIHDLVAAGRLTGEELPTMAAGLLMAGFETTSNHLGICAYLLLSRPALARLARRRPDVLPALVTELLRVVPFMATGGPLHTATEPVPLDGVTIPAGSVVIPVFDAANRDPLVFPDPDAIRPGRGPAHLAFGHGRHYCLGARLATLELEVGLRTLLDRLPGLRLAVPARQLTWRSGTFVRGIERLPVTW
jgi:cytochrome P450